MGARSVGLILLGSGLVTLAGAQQAPPAFVSCWPQAEVTYQIPAPGLAKHIPAMPVILENEPSTDRLQNDTPQTAEYITGFGPGGLHAVEVQGVLAMPEPVDLGTVSEESSDDGAIPLARSVSLVPGTRVRLQAQIGDGPHGSGGSQTGDYDFYSLGRLSQGQIVTVDITTEPVEPRLDTKVAIYNSGGYLQEQNDDGIFGQRDSYLEWAVTEEDEYYVIVRGINSDWPSDPFDPTSGPKVGSEGPYTLMLGLDATDSDWFSMDLNAGDVISASLGLEALRVRFADVSGDVLMNSNLDRSVVLPDNSPLLRGGNANLAHVAPHSGRFAVSASEGSGAYAMHLAVFRPGLSESGASQILFVDFDGAEYDAEPLGGHADARLSPLAYFLDQQNLADQQDEIIDRALSVLKENLIDDLQQGPNPTPALEILNSRDHDDPWGADNVSRIIVGGSQAELGINTVGMAESIDVGNFKHDETAIVLLDIITDPLVDASFASVERAQGVTMSDLLGLALGNVIAHEAGHLFASFHTGHDDHPVQLMAAGPDAAEFVGAGPDRILGTADDRDIDLGRGPYQELEGFIGFQDSRTAVAYGLMGSQNLDLDYNIAEGISLGDIYPNPNVGTAWLPVKLQRDADLRLEVYNMLGRLVYAKRIEHQTEDVLIAGSGLPSGLYVVRLTGDGMLGTRQMAIVR